MNLERLRK